MNFSADNLYYAYNQGNHRQIIFNEHEDYLIFLRMIRKLIIPHSEPVAYCLMPNHFHLMLFVDERSVEIVQQGSAEMTTLADGFRKLLSGYTIIFNNRYDRSGSLFRQKQKRKCSQKI